MSASRPTVSLAAALAIISCSTYGHARNGDAQPVDTCTGAYTQCKADALQLVAPYKPDGLTEIWPHADVIIEDAARRAQKEAMAGLVLKDGENTFRMTLGGEFYYTTANHYNVWPKRTPTNGPSKKDKGYCEFYIYNKNMDFESSYRAKVGVGARLTMCNSVIGVSGVAFRGQPALMAIAQYFYTGSPVAHSAGAIGTDWIRTTILLPLKQRPDGTWVFTQDTSCFPLTNTVDTLAKAKAHLMTCRARQPQDKALHEP